MAEVVEAAYGAGRRRRSGRAHELVRGAGRRRVVAASAADLAAMLDNLVENALNYSPAGTTVDDRAGRPTATWARLGVLDEGPGVDPDEGERVFERFYRGIGEHAARRAPASGLAVVEALAQRWGGEVALANRPQGGARAEVRLPAVRALPEPDPELDEALPGAG